LSEEIRKLEREMGVELFVCTKCSVVLTQTGRVFLERVRAVFDATANGVNVTPRAIADFCRSYPDVKLVLSELNSDEGMMILIGILFILPMIGAQMGLDFSIVSHVAAAVPVRSLRSFCG
jgi:DNA-binding transcriptional LysR family regulator